MAKHFYISFDSIAYPEIFPSNSPLATKRPEQGTRVWREEVDEFKIARSANETVYDTLETNALDKTEFDTEVELEIYEGIRTTGVLYWKGLFSVSDTKFDLQLKTFSIDIIRINDDYRTILEKADKQFELDVAITVLEQKRLGYSEPVSIGTTWINGTPGGQTAYDTLVASGGVILTAFAVAVDTYGAYTTLPALANNDIVIVDMASFTPGAVPTFDIVFGGSDTSMTDEGAKGLAVGNMAFTISTGQALPRFQLESVDGTVAANFTIRKISAANDHIAAGQLLMTFIEDFIDSVNFMHLTGFTGNVLSTFFNNDALPTGAPSSISTIMTGEPNGNYVTETATNELNNSVIGLLRKWFDALAPSSFKLSFNDIMASLRDMFQVYWFIDADGKFRIEHERYFVAQVADSTPLVLSAKAEPGRRAYNYNKSGIASTEQFSWSQSANRDFAGRDIIYNNFVTFNNTLIYSLSYITTDLKYVIDNLEDASNSGLGIFNCQILTGVTGPDIYEVIIATGVITSTPISNAEFSWANLHNDYWSWSRMSEDATRNGTAVTMDSAIRFLEQPGIRFEHVPAIDPFTLITAQLTGGAPIEIQRELTTDFVEIIIGYDPYKL